jgi:reactive intermediate/imine deaminase
MPARKTPINSSAITPPRPVYNHAIAANGFIFCSGQLPKDASGKIISGTVGDRTRQCILNLDKVLEAAGSSLDNVVEVNVFLSDMKDFAEMNGVYEGFWGKVKPSRT